MKKLFNILIIICGALLMNSCYYDEIMETPIPDIPDDQVVEYENDIQPIWNSNCIGCHDKQSPILIEGVSYDNLVPEYVIAGDADDSPLYQKLQSGAHEGRANIDEMALIKGWINQGAENN